MTSKAVLFILGLSVAMPVAIPASAQVDPVEIERMKDIVARHVREKKLREVPAARLTDSAIATLKLGSRFYRAGETWAVRFQPNTDPNVAAMPMKAEVETAAPLKREPVIYDFKVIGFTADGKARIAVTQRVVGGNRADPRVDHVVLTMNKKFVPSRKQIFYRDGRAPLSLAMDEHGVPAMGFEPAPLDLPNLETANGTPTHDESGKPALEFKVSDVYARPVSVLWREGEVWPARIVTTAGTAELIK